MPMRSGLHLTLDVLTMIAAQIRELSSPLVYLLTRATLRLRRCMSRSILEIEGKDIKMI
jgi:hypothetical protein